MPHDDSAGRQGFKLRAWVLMLLSGARPHELGPRGALDSLANTAAAAYDEFRRVTPKNANAPLPRLPQEIIDHIVDFLWDYPTTLNSCKLVSRACYSYITTFSGILELHSASAFSSLSKSLAQAAEKLRAVHSLHLRDTTSPWLYRVPLMLGHALVNVTRLYLYSWSPARTPLHSAVLPSCAQLRSVRTLFLADCLFKNVTQLQRLLGAFPELRVLGLRGVYVPAPRSPPEGTSGVVFRPPPPLTFLGLGGSPIKKREKGQINAAGALAGWFIKNNSMLNGLERLELWLTHAHLQEGELASIGQLVTAVGPHISSLRLDFHGVQTVSSDRVADWGNLRLDGCLNVQKLFVYNSSPRLHELTLLSPDCHIKSLILTHGRWHNERQATDWAALTTVLEGGAFNELEWLLNEARVPQSPAEAKALKIFGQTLRARGVGFGNRTEFPLVR